MKKDALQTLAAYGVRHKLTLMERELRELHRAFPEAFASDTPPILARPERKPNGNDWPVFDATTSDDTVTSEAPPRATNSKRSASMKKFWTPARKKEHRANMQAAAANKPWGTFVWQRLHDFLAKAPDRTGDTPTILKGAKIATSSSLATGVKYRPDLFDALGKGRYRLKKTIDRTKPSPRTVKVAKKPAARSKAPRVSYASKQPWGTYGWQRAHDYLKDQPKMTAHVRDIMKHAKINSQASFVTGVFNEHGDLFGRAGKKGSGDYLLKRTMEH